MKKLDLEHLENRWESDAHIKALTDSVKEERLECNIYNLMITDHGYETAEWL